MTYLDLCQRLRQYVGAAGTGPTNVSGQIGEYARFTKWIPQAWTEIQLRRDDWAFNWALGQIEVSDQFAEYSLPGDFRSFAVEEASLAGAPIKIVRWQDFRQDLQKGTPPSSMAIRPDQSLLLDRYPAGSGDLEFAYYRTPQVLSNSTDEPRMPARYHMAIIYGAMIEYGLYEAAPEVVEEGRNGLGKMLAEMEASQLPPMEMTGGTWV